MGNISYVVQLGLDVTLTAQMPLSNIDIHLPLKFVYQHLLDYGLIASTILNPMQPSFLRWYNPNERCENHGGVLGYLIENCKNLKYQVWKLVSKEQIEFVKNNGTYYIVTPIFNNDH